MKKILLSMLMIGTAMLFTCCTPDDSTDGTGNTDGTEQPGGDNEQPGGDNEQPGGGDDPAPQSVTVTVGEVTSNSAEVVVATNPEDLYFYMSLYTKADIDEYAQGDAAAIAQMEMAYMLEQVSNYNANTDGTTTLLDFWINEGIFQGAVELTVPSLRAETEYVVIYASVDNNGFTSDIYTTPFTTAPRPAGEEVAFVPDMASVECYGDWYEAGTNDQYLYLFKYMDNGQVASITLDIFTDINTHDGVGTFVADPDLTAAANTFWPGALEGSSLYPSCYMVSDGESIVEWAIIEDGEFAVTKTDAGYNIKGSLVADNGMTYTLDYNYTLSAEEETYYDECGVGIQKAAAKLKGKRSLQVYSTAAKMLSAKSMSAKRVRK